MIAVSACLAGVKCSYDGKARMYMEIAELVELGKAVPVCPEMLGGMPSPREKIEMRNGRVITQSGKDVTDEVTKGAMEALRIALDCGCREAVLKARSPSCGSGKVYDGTFSGKLVEGDGMFSAMLKKNAVRVLTEEEFCAQSFKENRDK